LKLADIDPTTLDPAISTETTSTQYIMLIYSGLLKLNSDLEPVGDIAESWDVSADGKVYTFNLRKDVTFQNGHAVTAADFKYSWERAANPSTGSGTAATYLGDIVGVSEMLSGAASQISGVTVKDSYTLQVTIDSPKSYFLYKLTYPASFVVDKKAVAGGSGWWREPDNGTGPFKLNQWTPGSSLTLVRNDDYYGDLPRLAEVDYAFYSGSAMDLYETGDIDVTGVSTAYLDLVQDSSGPFYDELQVSPGLSFSYIGYNCVQPPFDDPLVRRAFSLAIDKDKIIKLIYRDMESRADGVLPPGLPGYNAGLKGLGFDPEQARSLIESSSYGSVANLPEITLTIYGYGGSVGSVLQALVYQWQENLGVKVTLRQLETDRYFYNTKAEIDQMFLMGWVADYPHPQNFLDILFRSGGDYNYGSYSNSSFDNLVERANAELNEEQSFELYQQAEQVLVDDAACLSLTFGMNYILVNDRVKNYVINPLGFALLQDVYIE